MENLVEQAHPVAEQLREQHPLARNAAPSFRLTLRRQGVLQAWIDLMGSANHAPDPGHRAACEALRDGLIGWMAEQTQQADAVPRTVLTWLLQSTPEQQQRLRARLEPVLDLLLRPTSHVSG